MKTQIKAMKIELYAFLTEQIKSYKVSQKRTNKNGQTWQVCQNNCIKSMKNFFPTSIFPLYMELPKQSVLVGFRRRGLNNCWHFQSKLAARALQGKLPSHQGKLPSSNKPLLLHFSHKLQLICPQTLSSSRS